MTAPILRLSLPTPLRRAFDYLAPESIDIKTLQPGIRVQVPFQKRQLIGVLLAIANETAIPKNKLKRAIACIDTVPVVPPDILQLCLWGAEYYHHPVGEVVESALPILLRQGKPAEII